MPGVSEGQRRNDAYREYGASDDPEQSDRSAEYPWPKPPGNRNRLRLLPVGDIAEEQEFERSDDQLSEDPENDIHDQRKEIEVVTVITLFPAEEGDTIQKAVFPDRDLHKIIS